MGAEKPETWPSAMSFPSAGVGGWRAEAEERERSLDEGSPRRSAASSLTTIGPMLLGSMCRNMICRSPAPAAFAASTNSFSRSERNVPRTTRARFTQRRNARMSP